jgi:hypothetical protein
MIVEGTCVPDNTVRLLGSRPQKPFNFGDSSSHTMLVSSDTVTEEIMANDPRKRQKKLERRSAKRKEKRQVRVREQNVGLAERLRRAGDYPILHCWIGDSIADTGIGWVVLSRKMPSGSVAVVNFLVDSYCLGVKDVFAEILPHSNYEDKYLRKMRVKMPSREAAPAEARKLVEEAVAYARRVGFSPHADYSKTVLFFGNVNAADSDVSFSFGKDGKPLFISGPNDSEERCRQIVAILNKTCGPGQYDFIVGIDGSQSILLGHEGDEDFEEFGDEE